MDLNKNIEVPEEMRSQMVINPGHEEVEETERDDDQTLETTETVTTTTTDTPVYLGGREFRNMKELAEYASALETQKPAPQSETMRNANQPKVSDLMFTDQDAYHELTLEEAEKRVMDRIEKRDAEKKIWTDFRAKFPDLKDHDMIVETLFEKKKKESGNLPAAQLLDTIGKDARAYLNKVRGSSGEGKELPQGGAKVASTTNKSSQTKTVVTEPDEDFASALKRLKKKG
jgi:hypothetical protein